MKSGGKMTKKDMEYYKDRLEQEVKNLKEMLRESQFDAELKNKRVNIYLAIALFIGMVAGFSIASV